MSDQVNSVSRPWRRYLRVSVRGLIVLVLVVGGCLGWLVRSARLQREAVAAIRKADGEVSYDWEWKNGAGMPSKGPKVLRRLVEAFGVDYFGHVVQVSFSSRTRTRLLRRAEQLQEELDRQLRATNHHATNQKSGVSSDTLIGCSPDGAQFGSQKWEPNERETMLPLLKELSRLSFLNLSDVDLADDRLDWLDGLTSLTFLDLGNTGIMDNGLPQLRGLVKLSVLNLQDSKITDAGLAHLKDLPNLSELNLTRTQITDAGLAHLTRLTNLSKLALGATSITDAGLAHLEGLTQLSRLDLTDTKISDAGLECLEGLTNLTELDLKRNRITGAGIKRLRGLKRLSKLSVPWTVSDEEMSELEEVLPNLKIGR